MGCVLIFFPCFPLNSFFYLKTLRSCFYLSSHRRSQGIKRSGDKGKKAAPCSKEGSKKVDAAPRGARGRCAAPRARCVRTRAEGRRLARGHHKKGREGVGSRCMVLWIKEGRLTQLAREQESGAAAGIKSRTGGLECRRCNLGPRTGMRHNLLRECSSFQSRSSRGIGP